MRKIVCIFYVGVLLSLTGCNGAKPETKEVAVQTNSAFLNDTKLKNKEVKVKIDSFVWSDATKESLSESEYNSAMLGYMEEKYPRQAKKMKQSLQREAIKENTTVIGNLMWQDNESAKTAMLNWQDAKEYCKNLSLLGYKNWRLAEKEELQTLYTQKNKLKYVNPNYYWSSTMYENYRNYTWIVHFGYGSVFSSNKDANNYVRCVRDGQ